MNRGIIGAKIVEVREMTGAEMENEGWDHPHKNPVALVLSSGVILYASQDAEGNDSGEIFGVGPGGGQFLLAAGQK